MNQAFSKIWIIVIILLAGGTFAWQYFGAPVEEKETPAEEFVDETADWQTYRNEENLEIEKRDNTRQADIRQIATALEMHYGFEGRYVQSKTIPSSIDIYLHLFSFNPQRPTRPALSLAG